MRSRALTFVARSIRPLTVTPLNALELLLNATSAPVPDVLMVPPVIVLENWLRKLPLARLMTPPVLAMSLNACSEAVTASVPTLIVPELTVLPPLCKVSVNASMSTAPAFVSP